MMHLQNNYALSIISGSANEYKNQKKNSIIPTTCNRKTHFKDENKHQLSRIIILTKMWTMSIGHITNHHCFFTNKTSN